MWVPAREPHKAAAYPGCRAITTPAVTCTGSLCAMCCVKDFTHLNSLFPITM